MKKLLLGDEAIAQGAIDAGLSGVYAYPGTPSTEIRSGGVYAARTENFRRERRRPDEIFLPCGFSARKFRRNFRKNRAGGHAGGMQYPPALQLAA